MTEHDLMKQVLQADAPDFGAIERACLKELRRPNWIRNTLAAAAVLALAILSTLVIRSIGGGPAIVQPREPLTREAWEAAIACLSPTFSQGGEGVDAPFRLTPYSDGSLFAGAEDVTGTGYRPPLLKNTASAYSGIPDAARLDGLRQELLQAMGRFSAALGVSSDRLHEGAEPGGANTFWFSDPLSVDVTGGKMAFGISLFVNLDDHVLWTVFSGGETSLRYLSDAPTSKDALLADPYFLAFCRYLQIDDPVCRESGAEDSVVYSRGETAAEEADHYCRNRFAVRNLGTGEDLILTTGSGRNWVGAAVTPTGAREIAFSDAEACAKTLSGANDFLACTVLYFDSADGCYKVPCYCFWTRAREDEAQAGVPCYRFIVPAWDLSAAG